MPAAAAAGVAFACTPNPTGETIARGLGCDTLMARVLTSGGWTLTGGTDGAARARREVQAAMIAVETLRRSIAPRAGRGVDAPPIDVIERARALFAPGQVPIGGAVGDLLLDMIGEIERLRGTSTPPTAGGIRFTDLLPQDQAKLVEVEAAERGVCHVTLRLITLRLVESSAVHDGRYVITDTGRRVVDDWRADSARAQQAALVHKLTAEVARHAQALAAVNAALQENNARLTRQSPL